MPARSALGQLGPGSRGSANIPPLPFRGFLGVKKRGNETPDTEEAVRFNDGRFRVTTEAQLPARARFVFTGHWPLEAWGVGTLPR